MKPRRQHSDAAYLVLYGASGKGKLPGKVANMRSIAEQEIQLTAVVRKLNQHSEKKDKNKTLLAKRKGGSGDAGTNEKNRGMITTGVRYVRDGER